MRLRHDYRLRQASEIENEIDSEIDRDINSESDSAIHNDIDCDFEREIMMGPMVKSKRRSTSVPSVAIPFSSSLSFRPLDPPSPSLYSLPFFIPTMISSRPHGVGVWPDALQSYSEVPQMPQRLLARAAAWAPSGSEGKDSGPEGNGPWILDPSWGPN